MYNILPQVFGEVIFAYMNCIILMVYDNDTPKHTYLNIAEIFTLKALYPFGPQIFIFHPTTKCPTLCVELFTHLVVTIIRKVI
jgi:hypothetical protein